MLCNEIAYSLIHKPRPVLRSKVLFNLISGQVQKLTGEKNDLKENLIMILSDANEILLMSLGKLDVYHERKMEHCPSYLT